MSLFSSGQEIQLTLRGEQIQGLILFEKAKEIALRLEDHPVFKNDSIWTLLKNEFIHGEFNEGPFRCSFDTRIIDLGEDRASTRTDWILNLQIPTRIRRVNQKLQ